MEVVAGDEGSLTYSEGKTTTVTNTSSQEMQYLNFSGAKGQGVAHTPTNAKPSGGGGGGKKKKDHKKPDTSTRYHKIKAK
jgi:hypothetical protein